MKAPLKVNLMRGFVGTSISWNAAKKGVQFWCQFSKSPILTSDVILSNCQLSQNYLLFALDHQEQCKDNPAYEQERLLQVFDIFILLWSGDN
jgi:hypothetical protein